MIDYEQAIIIGCDYNWNKFNLMKKFPAPRYIGFGNKELDHAYEIYSKYEARLGAVEDVCGIPTYAVIRAARIYNRFWSKASGKYMPEDSVWKRLVELQID